MAITTNLQIQEGLIEHLNILLDAYATANLDFPVVTNVIKDRQGGARPNYPYIVVEKASTANEAGGAWLREQYVDENDVVTYISEQKVFIKVTCYGEDSIDILNIVRALAVDDLIRYELNNLTGAKFQYYTEVEDTPEFLETDFIQASTISCYFNMLTELKQFAPFETSTIEAVEGYGELFETEEDEDPIIININIKE